MHIKPLGTDYQNSKAGAFKSVIPLHFWAYNDKVMSPITDINKINKFQKKVSHIFNRRMAYGKKSSNDFFNRLIEYLAQNDKNYKDIPYVVTFYNKNAGKNAERNGESAITAIYSYLITGKDAVKFQDRFITPLINGDSNDKETRSKYFLNGIKFIAARRYKYLEKRNLEMHAIFTEDELIKIGFYPTSGQDNPYVRLGYKK